MNEDIKRWLIKSLCFRNKQVRSCWKGTLHLWFPLSKMYIENGNHTMEVDQDFDRWKLLLEYADCNVQRYISRYSVLWLHLPWVITTNIPFLFSSFPNGTERSLKRSAWVAIVMIENASLKDITTLCMKNLSLTHWGRDKMGNISQTAFSNAFSWMTISEFQLMFHFSESLFLRVKWTIFQHRFR